MTEASSGGLDIMGILYMVSRYVFPLLLFVSVVFVFLFFMMEIRNRSERVRSLPGSGTIGELIVLSGSRELDANTWFPVPREGILGSVRSCDLVIPCPGVRAKHLDFSWEDGLGLLIRPYTGCEVLINGMPVTCRTDASSIPMIHGSVLQVGSAFLRLHLFAALDNMSPVQSESAPAMEQEPCSSPIPAPVPNVYPYQIPVAGPAGNIHDMNMPVFVPAAEDHAAEPDAPSPSVGENLILNEQNESSHPLRSDRWKEDFGE